MLIACFFACASIDDAMCCDDDGEGNDEENEEDEELEEGDEEMDAEDGAVGGGDSAMADGATKVSSGVDADVETLCDLVEEYGLDNLYPPLDGTAFYSLICRINHSCDPNVRVTYTCCPQRGLLATLVALKPIQPGEELVQSYIDQFKGLAARQKALKDYGFVCKCAKCAAEGAQVEK